MKKTSRKGLLFSEDTARNITESSKQAAKEAAALTAIFVALMLAGTYALHKKTEEANIAHIAQTEQPR